MFQSNNLKCHFVCAWFFCRFYSVGRFTFIFLFTSRCLLSSTLAPCMLFSHYSRYSHFVAESFLLLLLAVFVASLFAACFHCYCMSSCYLGAPALERFMGSCHYRCHVLHLRFINATDGLPSPFFNFCIVIENQCDSSDTWY